MKCTTSASYKYSKAPHQPQPKDLRSGTRLMLKDHKPGCVRALRRYLPRRCSWIIHDVSYVKFVSHSDFASYRSFLLLTHLIAFTILEPAKDGLEGPNPLA